MSNAVCLSDSDTEPSCIMTAQNGRSHLWQPGVPLKDGGCQETKNLLAKCIFAQNTVLSLQLDEKLIQTNNSNQNGEGSEWSEFAEWGLYRLSDKSLKSRLSTT